METIASACISAGVTLIVCMINTRGQQKRAERQQNEAWKMAHQQQSETRALMEYKLDELAKRVDKHNHLVERTYRLEETAILQEEKIKVANHRIEDLERGRQGT